MLPRLNEVKLPHCACAVAPVSFVELVLPHSLSGRSRRLVVKLTHEIESLNRNNAKFVHTKNNYYGFRITKIKLCAQCAGASY